MTAPGTALVLLDAIEDAKVAVLDAAVAWADNANSYDVVTRAHKRRDLMTAVDRLGELESQRAEVAR